MKRKTVLVGIILIVIVFPSVALSLGFHAGPMGLVFLGNKPQPYHKPLFILGGNLYIPLNKYTGIMIEGGFRFNKDYSQNRYHNYLFVGSGVRINPFPGKLGYINPYLNAIIGINFEDYNQNLFYLRTNLGTSFSLKKIHTFPYIEAGLYLGIFSNPEPMFNIACGVLF